jgi:hypothetical protein
MNDLTTTVAPGLAVYRIPKRGGGWPKGKPKSPETRAKIAAAKRGKPLSPETRAKIAAAMRGKPLSPETRAKIAASKRNRRE